MESKINSGFNYSKYFCIKNRTYVRYSNDNVAVIATSYTCYNDFISKESTECQEVARIFDDPKYL